MQVLDLAFERRPGRFHGGVVEAVAGGSIRRVDAPVSEAVGELEASSGRVKRHRLNRGGNRQLNKAIHVIAIAQIARATTEGRRYYDKKLAEGKTKREAIRALKRRISHRVWTHLQHTDPIISLT